jgi:hypothetical protein
MHAPDRMEALLKGHEAPAKAKPARRSRRPKGVIDFYPD